MGDDDDVACSCRRLEAAEHRPQKARAPVVDVGARLAVGEPVVEVPVPVAQRLLLGDVGGILKVGPVLLTQARLDPHVGKRDVQVQRGERLAGA